MEEKQLPRILYYSGVPVESSFAGATLIFRLLEHYPKEKLLIIQGMELNKAARISGVSYYVVKWRWLNRLKSTRFNKWITTFTMFQDVWTGWKYGKKIRIFNPDIILTVTFQLMWVKAFRLAQAMKIPLHVILHDDWLTTEHYGVWQVFLSGMFKKMYIYAAGRFCISPNMEKYYFGLYGIRGSILYPFRGREDRVFLPKEFTNSNEGPVKFCYAGSLFTGDFAQMLDAMAETLAKKNCELHIFSPIDSIVIEHYESLKKPHVKFHDFLSSQHLVRKLSEEMDVCIMVNSFEHEMPFRYNFSSKLVDYTSSGLPVLMWGAPTSGAISWAIQAGYSGVIKEFKLDLLDELILRFLDSSKRTEFSKQMTRLGELQFSYHLNYEKFIKIITYAN
jgi:glycosyltransferase involved in cell wall biosynthesis